MPKKGALVGCGYFGQIQLEAWRRMPEAEIAAACDLDLEKARRSAPRGYTSPEEMLDLEKPDFVDIATRPESHLALVRMAAARGIPVICQKPMAPTWKEAVALSEAAESARIRLMIHENWRWQPWFRIVQRLLAEDRIGAPIAYSLRTRAADGSGPEPYKKQPYFRTMPRLLIHETLVHHIDTARFLFGEIATIHASARRINPAILGEDQAILTIVHESGLMGAVDGHRFIELAEDSPPIGDAVVEGERGCLAIRGNGDVYAGAGKIWTNTVTAGYRGDSVLATQRHFIECLESGREFESGGLEYLKTFAAVEACYRSIGSKCAVAVQDVARDR